MVTQVGLEKRYHLIFLHFSPIYIGCLLAAECAFFVAPYLRETLNFPLTNQQKTTSMCVIAVHLSMHSVEQEKNACMCV